MDIAPSPLLVRQSYHYRVVSFLVVLRGMKTDRRITTSYMTTNEAHTQCDPISAFDLTFFASCCFWVHVFVCTSKMFTSIFRIHIKYKESNYIKTVNFSFLSTLRSEEHTSELQSPCNLVCRLLLEKKK